MQKELGELKGTVERIEEGLKIRIQENERRMNERMDVWFGVMTGQIMNMIKEFMGEGAVGGVASATGKGLLVEEKVKVSNNGNGSDSDSNSDSEVKGTTCRYCKDEQKGERKEERKGKSDVKKEKKKCQDKSEDDREWVKLVIRKRARKSIIKDRSMSAELDSLCFNKEVGNKKEGSSDDSCENERDVCKTLFMREVPWCERFNELSSKDIYKFFKE
ncbi:uncharacterized protein [Palaemon carinicauda]|uniref:uncharacterized protein n=1 Tax=Palaemon carinicauda TaxID=392227 RepID=UPI0035B5B858